MLFGLPPRLRASVAETRDLVHSRRALADVVGSASLLHVIAGLLSAIAKIHCFQVPDNL
jgi:hypothetical protein